MSIKIRDYKGYEIQYDSDLGRFTAVDSEKEIIFRKDTEKAIIEAIDKAAKIAFKPIRAFNYQHKPGRITSFNPDMGRHGEGWFVSDDGTREEFTAWKDGGIGMYSEANQETIDKIHVIQKQIKDLERQKAELVVTLIPLMANELNANLKPKEEK